MAKNTITIIDYGAGNLHSVKMACESLAYSVRIGTTAADIDDAMILILPGVGAFKSGMAGLNDRGLVTPIYKYLQQHRPFLGICLGFQLLFEQSEEHGLTEGLGIFPGTITQFSPPARIPHMGWNLVNQQYYYFVHSYFAPILPTSPPHTVTTHGSQSFISSVTGPNFLGTQFHPEKSGAAGIELLVKFFNSVT